MAKKNIEEDIQEKEVKSGATVKIAAKDKKDLTERLEKPVRLIYYLIGIVGSVVALLVGIGYLKIGNKVEEVTSQSMKTERKVDTLTQIVKNNIVEKVIIQPSSNKEEIKNRTSNIVENTFIERKTVVVDTVKTSPEKSPFNTIKNENYKKREKEIVVGFKFLEARLDGNLKQLSASSIKFILSEDILLGAEKIRAGSSFSTQVSGGKERVFFSSKLLKGMEINLSAIDQNNSLGIPYQEVFPDGYKVRFRYE